MVFSLLLYLIERGTHCKLYSLMASFCFYADRECPNLVYFQWFHRLTPEIYGQLLHSLKELATMPVYKRTHSFVGR